MLHDDALKNKGGIVCNAWIDDTLVRCCIFMTEGATVSHLQSTYASLHSASI